MSAEEIDDMEMDMASDGSRPLFWSMKLEPNKPTEIDQPAIPEYIVHVTNACFGVNVTKGSRSLVMVNPSDDSSDTSNEAPVCVLRQGQNENQSLDLLFNESATITIKGQKASTVYLSGYLQPPIDADAGLMDPSLEDMDEAEIEEALKRQRLQQQALDDEDGEEEPELMDEDEIEEPPTKKQKTDKGSKATKNGENTESKKKRKSPQQKAKKSPQQKPVETSLDDKKEEKEKEDKEEKKASPKKDKKMKNMGKGLKYRDMKVGKGKPVANGDKLFVYYVGQLDDKKVFDKCISGKGFDFEFGKGKVIKGWDMGMKGMKKGGKRKLIIPSKLAYGAAGSEPNIPPNAQLTFTIELRNIA